MGGFYNIVLIIYLYVVHVIICNPRNSASGCNVVSILIIIIINNNNNNNKENPSLKIDVIFYYHHHDIRLHPGISLASEDVCQRWIPLFRRIQYYRIT